MAQTLEFYKSNTTTQTATDSTSYVTYHSLTVDRSGESITKNFFVFANVSTRSEDAGTTDPNIQFRHDTTTLMEYNGDGTSGGIDTGLDSPIGAPVPVGFSYSCVKRVSLTAASHTIDIRGLTASASAGDNLLFENAAIMVLEESTDSEYAESTSETSTANATLNNKLALTFTPGTEQNYTFIWAAETRYEDDNDADHDIAFTNTTDAVIFQQAKDGDVVSSTNDDLYFCNAGVAFEVVEASEHVYAIQYAGGTNNLDEVRIRNSAIVALPDSDFTAVFSDIAVAVQKSSSLTLEDTNLSITQSFADGKEHAIFFGTGVGNENLAVQSAFYAINYDGTDIGTQYSADDRNQAADSFWLQNAFYGFDGDGTSNVAKIQFGSSSTAGASEGRLGDSYMMIVEIQAAAGGAGPAKLKTADTVAAANIKTINGTAIAKVKTWDTVI